MSRIDRLRRGVRRRAGLLTDAIASRVPRPPQPAILMYHRIATDRFDPWATLVSPKRFREQLQWLSARRTVLPLRELVELNSAGKLPSGAVAITFDDGYSCNAEVAAPMLAELRLAATMFLPVEWVERGRPYWWDEIRAILFQNPADHIDLNGKRIDLGHRRADDETWAPNKPPRTPRQAAFHLVWAELLMKKPAEIDRSMAELRGQFAACLDTVAGPMSREQIRAAANAGIDFGSHALNHAMLTELQADEQAREIKDSVARCERLTGTRPLAFAYPYGVFDQVAEQAAAEAGFLCAVSTDPRPVTPESRRFALPRLHVRDWSAGRLERALALHNGARRG